MDEVLELNGGPVEVDSRGWTITLTVCVAAKGKLVSMLKMSDPSVLQGRIKEVLAANGA